MSNSEIRAKARQDLGGNIFNATWMTALAAYLIYLLIVGACSAVPYVGSVASLLLTGPLVFGVTGYFLKLARSTEKPSIDGLFDGFKDFLQNFLLYFMTSLFTFLWSLLLIIPGIVKSYAYSMAFYIRRDNPTYSWKECLDESQRIMNGHKADLFCLHLSFIGWALLCICTCGIGFLWLYPYIEAANANFYDSLVEAPAAPAVDAPSNGPENTFESAE